MSRPHPKLTLSPNDDGLELTHEDFAEADYDEPWGYERVNGRLLVVPPRDSAYQFARSAFLEPMIIYYLSRPEIVQHVYTSPWIVIDEFTERIADIGVYFPEANTRANFPYCVPQLVYEVVGVAPFDRKRKCEEKREEYQRIGVWEYVIVDHLEHRVLVLELTNGNYAERELGPNDFYTSALLPGLEIPLAEILE